MSNRYSERNRITGKLFAELRALVIGALNTTTALETFVADRIGRDISNSVNWNQAITHAGFELINQCQCRGKVALLVEQLLEAKPDNAALVQLVEYLVDAGYLIDCTKAQVPSTNPSQRNWMTDFPFDHVVLNDSDRTFLIGQVASCFESPAQVERFLGDNFDNELGAQLRQGVDRSQSVLAVVTRLVNELARIHRLNCFILAAQKQNQTLFELGMTAMAIQLAYNPPKAPVAPAPAAVAIKPAPPKVFRVIRTTGVLTPPLYKEVVDLLLRAFGQGELRRLVDYNLDERLDNIVANGPFRTVCEDLIRWCEQHENKLAPLFNAVLKDRPSRTDVRPLLQKLAAANIIELEQ